MTSPFIYTPSLSELPEDPPSPYVTAYYTPYSPHSPFLPGSDYSSPLSPNPSATFPSPPPPAPRPRPVSLPPSGPTTYATWTDILTRPRGSTYVAPMLPPYGYEAPSTPIPTSSPTPYIPTWHYYQPYVLAPALESPRHPQLHPYLDFGSPNRPDFLFDLGLPTFSPMRMIRVYNGPALLNSVELSQSAMYPQRTSLRVICDPIPQWPMDLVYSGCGAPPPITLGDVLSVVHTKLREGITSADWRRLTQGARMDVANTYRRRCRNAGEWEAAERAQGVKKVDFLNGRTTFMGLKWVGDGCLRLLIG
ncbi:hypothetical protein BDV98DRAFT_577088 [Pterulicium gracile]|uniref:DUF6699 domain-containing protein n=1 Tax=Pterulicium gracile TaxID=1884261 RepID=A0A5C3Q1Y2_9AGAR|nr:hypothetical protein BDV98DRAFT_577088 [Pterula gracilis]